MRELEKYPDLVRQRDDLSIELCALYNQTGQHEKADAIGCQQASFSLGKVAKAVRSASMFARNWHWAVLPWPKVILPRPARILSTRSLRRAI